MLKTLIILTLLFCTTFAWGQTYHPMLSDSNKWYSAHVFETCYPDSMMTRGDTIISNKYYKKILDNYNPANSIGYIREDTINKEVFIKLESTPYETDTFEFKFYDFKLMTGDSMYLLNPNILSEWFFYGVDTLGWYTVDSVSTINTNSGARKAIYLSDHDSWNPYFYSMIWVEGIGAVNGAYIAQLGDVISTLTCAYEDTNLVYSVFGGCICLNTVGSSTITSTNNNFLISPNPTVGVITLYYYYTEYLETKISILDLSGRNLKEQIVSETKTDIDISNLSDGIYILRLENKKQTFNKKIIKTSQ